MTKALISKLTLTAVAILFLIFCPLARAQDTWSWQPPTEDTNGNPIARENLYYKIYWGYDNSEWYFSTDYNEDSVVLSGIPAGCYYFALTAVRVDTPEPLESELSESVQYCVGVEPTNPNPPTDSQINE